ncbi:MAG TPA: hypothetical protein VMZ29_09325 [Candidatus Bathyarchaeia archaeon]|nr:hypothetical protein [Candidatus Bathyarchaeia archaeon]
MKNKKLIVFMGSVIMIIIPLMSLNIEQLAQATTEQIETELTTDGYVTIEGLSSWSYNLGYLRGNYHDLVDWEFDSEDETLKIMLMTETNYQNYIDGYSYTYTLLSEGEYSDSGLYAIVTTNNYRVVFRNTHLFSTYAYIYATDKQVEAQINYVTISHGDYDNDGYTDKFSLTISLDLNYILPTSVWVEYRIEIENENYQTVDIFSSNILLSGYTRTAGYTFDDGVGTFKISVVVYYDDEYFGDDTFSTESDYLYPIGYAQQLADEAKAEKLRLISLSVGIPTGLLAILAAILVPVLVIRKRKASIKP